MDLFYLVTDQGWRITKAQQSDRAPVGDSDGAGGFIATKLGETRRIAIEPVTTTAYDGFAASVAAGAPLPATIASLDEAAEDIHLIRAGGASPGSRIAWRSR